MSKKNDLKGAYGIKNINEMLAELSNPEFRALVEEGGFWQTLLNAIKRMFGFEGTYNAELKELDNILSSFLENYNEEAYMDAVESIYGEDIFTTIEEVDAKEIDNQGKERYSVKEVNNRFNEELQQQIDGTLPKGHIYKLGMPSDILQSAGIPLLPIELAASRLVDKSMQDNHPFKLSEVENLPMAIHNPLVVFRSATHIGSNVILTELKHNVSNFVIALKTNKKKGKILINDIRSVHYRKSLNVINWILEDLADYIKPTFEQEWLIPIKNELRSQPQYNSAEVRTKLNDVTKIVQNFENPKIEPKNSLKSLDAPYLDAVARGDMATAERLVREAAAIAMPNTMILDEDGLPKVVYHQTNANVYINRET